MATAHEVCELARKILLDVESTVYKDDILLPFVFAAWDDLYAELAKRGYARTEGRADIALAALQTSVSTTSTPPLPTDFIAPQRLWEKITGSTDKFMQVRIWDSVPDIDASTTLRYWVWQDGEIKLVGATGPVTIRLEYVRKLPALTSAGSSIDSLPLSKNFLTWKAVAGVTMGRGELDLVDRAEGRAMGYLERMIDTYTMADQYNPVRRAYYGSRDDDE